MAMIAAKCPDYRIHVVDINEERVEQWKRRSGGASDLRARRSGRW